MADLDSRIVLAALGPPETAFAAWTEWWADTPQAEAPGILSWAGGYIYRNLRDAGIDDAFLGGIYRHNWLVNNRKVVRIRSVLTDMSQRFSIVPLKSLARSMTDNSRGLRPVADADVFLPYDRLAEATEYLEQRGYRALLGIPSEEVSTRVARRRGSWNYVDDEGNDIDLHWRIFDHLTVQANGHFVAAHSRVADCLFGPTAQLSHEALALNIVGHSWMQANEQYNGLFDFADLVTRCDAAALWDMADRVELSALVAEVNDLLASILGAPPLAAAPSRPLRAPWSLLANVDPRTVAGDRVANGQPVEAARNPEIPERREPERLRHPRPYEWWALTGYRPMIERMLIRLTGPLSQPPPSPPSRIEFGDTVVTGPLLGPGWCYQIPHDAFRWTDGPDARVLLDGGRSRRTRVLSISLDPHSWEHSANRFVDVFVNGTWVGTCTPGSPQLRFPLPAAIPAGIVEVSIRPRYPLPFRDLGPGTHFFRLSLPVKSIGITSPQSLAP